MLLTPSDAPPISLAKSLTSSRPEATATPLRASSMPTPKTTSQNEAAMRARIQGFKIPAVILDSDTISTAMAARLSTSLLGHILFLKSQVPFPVIQMARIPGGQSESRAAKKRLELISAMDTLASHLRTTFIALSTALARSTSARVYTENGNKTRSAAHMAFLLGPSIGSARARVVLVIDGLEVKVWGTRQEMTVLKDEVEEVQDDETHLSDSDEDSDEDSEDLDGQYESDDDDVNEDSGDECPEDSESESDHEPGVESPTDSGPPSSTPPSSAHQASPQIKHLPLSPLPTPAHFRARTPVYTQTSLAEEEQTLRAADRLLSRTLANACAEEGGGMACELAPTHMHVLLRAPRRFEHPAWVPRQNLTSSLEGMLGTFLQDAGVHEPPPEQGRAKRRTGVKTEGVWVGCPGAVEESGVMEASLDEEDEMIWWVWDGKISGFADWA